MKKALILVDIQNEYFPGGECQLVGINKASENAADLLSFYRENKLPLFHVQHLEISEGADCFIPGTPGVEINSKVAPRDGEEVIQKNNPNSFLDTQLKEKLNTLGITHVILCGAMSHMCIDATARAALDLNLKCTVVQDACATLALEFNETKIPAEHVHGAFMAALGEAGCEVINLSELVS